MTSTPAKQRAITNKYQLMILLAMHDHAGLQNLLDLAGSVIDQGDGYWLKIEAWSVEPSKEMPHGIRYALTLHEPYGKRILGYDNAHGIKPPKKFKFAGKDEMKQGTP